MNNLYSPLLNSLPHNLACIALASLLAAFPALANAKTVCEKGLITTLEHQQGGGSYVLIATEKSPAADWQRYKLNISGVGENYGTQMWQENDARWRDRLSLLRTAYALQQPVYITSSDSNCMGPSDEFSITLCGPANNNACL